MSGPPDDLDISQEQSIIGDLFDIKCRTQYKCKTCENVKNGSVETNNCLTLGIPADVITLAGVIEKVKKLTKDVIPK